MIFKTLALKLAETEVDLGGTKVKMRALRVGDGARILAAMPRPEPATRIPDPAHGSLSPRVPDEYEPGFQGKLHIWYRQQRACQLAVALDLQPEGYGSWSDAKDDKAWCEAAQRDVFHNLDQTQFDLAYKKFMELLDPAAIRGALIEEVDGPETADEVVARRRWKLPDRYRVSDIGAALRICRTFGIDPFRAFNVPYDDPVLWPLLEEQVRILDQERSRRSAPAESAEVMA